MGSHHVRSLTNTIGNIGQVYGGKFVVGIGLGQMSVVAPAYVAVVALFAMSLSIQDRFADLHAQGMCAFAK